MLVGGLGVRVFEVYGFIIPWMYTLIIQKHAGGWLTVFWLSPYKTSKSPCQPGGVPPLCRWASLDCVLITIIILFIYLLYHIITNY